MAHCPAHRPVEGWVLPRLRPKARCRSERPRESSGVNVFPWVKIISDCGSHGCHAEHDSYSKSLSESVLCGISTYPRALVEQPAPISPLDLSANPAPSEGSRHSAASALVLLLPRSHVRTPRLSVSASKSPSRVTAVVPAVNHNLHGSFSSASANVRI
jgi:hypothetical protein